VVVTGVDVGTGGRDGNDVAVTAAVWGAGNVIGGVVTIVDGVVVIDGVASVVEDDGEAAVRAEGRAGVGEVRADATPAALASTTMAINEIQEVRRPRSMVQILRLVRTG
jgi:hypothetical protein